MLITAGIAAYRYRYRTGKTSRPDRTDGIPEEHRIGARLRTKMVEQRDKVTRGRTQTYRSGQSYARTLEAYFQQFAQSSEVSIKGGSANARQGDNLVDRQLLIPAIQY